ETYGHFTLCSVRILTGKMGTRRGLIQGGHLRRLASVGAPSDPAPPLDGPKEAGDLALRKAFTAQARPTLRAAGPERRGPGPFGQHGFDEMDSEDTGHLPRRQDQGGEGGGVFDRAQQTLHIGVIVAYAVV